MLAWRLPAVDAAHPHEVVPLLVPGPIAFDPNDIFAVWFRVGRDFFDVGGRFPIDRHGCSGIQVQRFGKSFMHRSAVEDLRAGDRWSRLRWGLQLLLLPFYFGLKAKQS